jgi:hypothetical protein
MTAYVTVFPEPHILKEDLLEKSKLAKHAYEEYHWLGWNEARILEIESNSRYRKYKESVIKFEVFTAVTMKNVVFWNVAPCRYCANRRFGGTYHIHIHGIKSRERGTSVSRWLQTG